MLRNAIAPLDLSDPPRHRVLFLSHTAEGGDFKVGSHHLARELSHLGFQVAHVSTPVSLLHVIAKRGHARKRELALNGGVRDEHGTFHSVPLVALPVQMRSGARGLRRYLRKIGFWNAELTIVDQPLMGNVLGLLSSGTVVYRPTDEVFGSAAVRRQEHLLNRVDCVIATSARVLDALNLDSTTPSLVLENGVEFSRFAGAPDSFERAGMVYVGALDHRFDWNLIGLVAQIFPEETIRLIGPIGENPPILPSNIKLLGALPYEQLDKELRRSKVGLLPLNEAAENAGRSPMKYFEYLAAELYVVGKATPALMNRNAPGASLYSEFDGSVDAIRSALAQPNSNWEGRRFAEGQDWSHKAALLLQFVQETAIGNRHD